MDKNKRRDWLMAGQLIILMYMMTVVGYNTLDTDLGLIMAKHTEYFMILAGIGVLLLFGLEFIYSKPWIRASILLIMIITCFLMAADGIAQLNAAIWFFSIVYAVIVVIVYMISLFKNKDKTIKNKKTEIGSKVLPIGAVLEKEYNKSILLQIIMTLISIAFLSVWIWVWNQNFMLGIFIVFIVNMASFITIALTCNSFLKSVNKLEATTNYSQFESEITQYLNSNLHADTKSYIQTIQTNALFAVDLEKGLSLFEAIEVPKFKTYKHLYDAVLIYYYVNKKDEKMAFESFNVFKGKSKNKVMIKRAEMVLNVEFNNNEILDIQTIFRVDDEKRLFSKIVNAWTLMKYYHTRDMNDLAYKYAKVILDNHHDLEEVKKDALAIMKE